MPPRPSGTARKNQNGTRHENGLVLPGKKVAKQKSNGHLNGSAHGLQPTTTLPAQPAQVIPPVQQQLPAAGSVANNVVKRSADRQTMEINARIQSNGNACGKTDLGSGNNVFMAASASSSSPSPAPNGAVPYHSRLEDSTCRQAVQSPKKSHASRSVNPFVLASTILKACPMSDTIAILIFLLQLPPIVLTLVQFLYASMTFMLPAGMTSGTLTSNFDIFQGPAGTPSLGTMIAMDGFCLFVWGLFMWDWAQHFAIDLAHVQVAIALGAGSSTESGSVNVLCMAFVLLVHLLRSEGVQTFVVGHLLSYKLVTAESISRISYLIPAELRRKEPSSPPSWVRSLLAVHILAQAGTAMARRSMAKNRSPPRTKGGKRADTEAFAGTSQPQADSSAIESTTNPSSTATPEVPSVVGTTTKDSRERISSAKKRRRQANEARRIQPFWAALASTKLTVTREYERSRNGHWYSTTLPVAEDDVDAASLDNGLIWITDVDGSTIKFAASDFSTFDDGNSAYDNGFTDSDAEPFYVRVNGAQWVPVTLNRVSEDSGEGPLVHWRGEVCGLAPDCAYTCSFVRCDTNEEICVMSVKTPPMDDTEQAHVAPSISPSPGQSLRPSSPTTTIRNSIANAEAKLNERRSRLKKAKNDHKLHLSKLKKELDNFSHRLNSGGDEGRQKQRSLQLERTIRQTEEATSAIEAQLNSLEKIPAEELREWTARKADHEQELERIKTLKAELEAARTASNRDVSSLETELISVVQKRERLQSRRARLTEQYDRITAANNQGMNERERRAAEQLAREREHATIEGTFYEQFASITKSVQDLQTRTTQLSQQASAIEHMYQQQQHLLMTAEPLTPEGELPGTNPLMAESARGLSSLSQHSPLIANSLAMNSDLQQPYSSSSLQSMNPLFSLTHRDRSSSNLSARHFPYAYNSSFLGEDSADFAAPVGDNTAAKAPVSASPIGHHVAVNRAGSRASGSGSGSGSGTGSGSGSPHSLGGKLVRPS